LNYYFVTSYAPTHILTDFNLYCKIEFSIVLLFYEHMNVTALLDFLDSPAFPRYIDPMKIMGVSAWADVPSFVFIADDTQNYE
jgi:hypothetical protein